MQVKQLTKFGLAALASFMFLQVNVFADSNSDGTSFDNVKIDSTMKRVMPEDRANVLSQRTINRLNEYNTSSKLHPRLQIYTVDSVPGNKYENYLIQQIKMNRDTNRKDRYGEIHYLIITKNNERFVTTFQGELVEGTNIKMLQRHTKKYTDSKNYDKLANQIITNVNDNLKQQAIDQKKNESTRKKWMIGGLIGTALLILTVGIFSRDDGGSSSSSDTGFWGFIGGGDGGFGGGDFGGGGFY